MTSTRKVVWAEGTLLTQQHFQQWEYYHHQQHYLLMTTLKSHAWGISQLIIDKDLLRNGIFLIQQCKIIFQDGKLIQYDASIDPPLSYQLTSKINQQNDIYLCLPLGKRVANISGYPTTDFATTWQADYQTISDENDHDRQQEVLMARPHLILCSTEESREHFEAIKIAEILPVGIASYQLSDNYIPPLLTMTGSFVLCNACNRWIEFITAKTSILKDNYQHLQNKNTENTQSGIVHLLLLQSLTNTLFMLRHHQAVIAHPEQLYTTLMSLMSSLSIFDNQFEDTILPVYDHTQLYKIFYILEGNIKSLLEKAMPSPMAIIMLHRINDTLYIAENIENDFFEQHHFYLAVKREATDKQWIEQFLSQIKLSAYSTIKLIAAMAVTGVKMNYTQRLPHNLSIKPGFEYFYIEQTGEAWQDIKQERSLALFLPYALSNASIELITMADQ